VSVFQRLVTIKRKIKEMVAKMKNDDVKRELIFKENGQSHTQVGRKDYVTFVVRYIKKA